MSRKKPKPSTDRRRIEQRLDESLRDTFPASDPVSLTQPARRDGPVERKDDKKPARRGERP